MDFFKLADNAISEAYPGKPGMWCAQRIPGILRGAIVAALQSVERRTVRPKRRRTVRPKRAVQQAKVEKGCGSCRWYLSGRNSCVDCKRLK